MNFATCAIRERQEYASMSHKPVLLGLFGCPLDTGNNGVSALAVSMITGLSDRGVEPVIFGNTPGTRRQVVRVGSKGQAVSIVGCSASRRVYRLTNLRQLQFAARIGLAQLHPVLRWMRRLDAVCDISAGDSFSDIYGIERFNSVLAPKLLSLQLGVPLILPPQTYGPFRTDASKRIARDVLRRATQVWARDRHSLEVVADLIGRDFDPGRHREGIDVAFGLPVSVPDAGLIEQLDQFRKGASALIGLNVSGLLFNHPGEDVQRFGLRSDYPQMIRTLLGRLLAEEGVRVLLIPHVTSQRGESDGTANSVLKAQFAGSDGGRVFTVPGALSPSETKWIIGQCDWFCGTRMHACIAALSQSIPTVGVAYSDKTRGVFESVAVESSVMDPRYLTASELVEQVMDHFKMRSVVRQALRHSLLSVEQRLAMQFEAMLGSATHSTKA